MDSTLREFADRWEREVAHYLEGRRTPSKAMSSWFRSYSGRDDCEVDLGAFPEPYVGALTPAPKMVTLGLNPGRTFPAFQASDGIFADEIRELGSYHAWSASEPYMRHPWLKEVGPSNYRRSVRFMRRWYDDPTLLPSGLLVVESFPWHSTKFDKGRYRPDAGTVREWVWEPVVATGAPIVFAFGAWWYDQLPTWPGMEIVDRLGVGGRDYGGNSTRSVLVLRPRVGPPVVVEKHAGAAGPPSAAETRLLREALPNLVPEALTTHRANRFTWSDDEDVVIIKKGSFRDADHFHILRMAVCGLCPDDAVAGSAIERGIGRLADAYNVDSHEVFAAVNEGFDDAR
jgi:hypothetical protein